MTYSSATFFLDYESGSDSARTALTSVAVANNGAGLVRCTKAAHGLVTGAVGTASLNYSGPWKITVIDANNFDLVGSTYASATALTFTPFGGSSKADAFRTFTSGATGARIAPGDTIRVMASPTETLVGNVTWTQGSQTLTLAGAVTANINTCNSAWTPSANVTASTTASCKEGTAAATLAIAGAFTTGLVGYSAAATADLSSYQQVSWWIKASAAVAASTLSLRLCSDASGVTTVHTVTIPALPGSLGNWTQVTVDLGSNMNSSIGSVALYADLDPGSVTISLDNIIACKASSSADSLTLSSLIGKVRNTAWAAATTYAVNDMRIPSAPNRNGYCYKVTAQVGASAGSEPSWPLGTLGVTTVLDGGVTWRCEDIEEAWYPIRSINGTTVKIDGAATSIISTTSQGYAGTSETVATYKREAIKTTMIGNTSTAIHLVNDNGSSGLPITFSGGWNRTDMTTQTGQSWFDGQNGNGSMFHCSSATFIELRNFGAVRAYNGILDQGEPGFINNMQCVGMVNAGWFCIGSAANMTGRGLVLACSTVGLLCSNNSMVNLARFRIDSCDSTAISTPNNMHNGFTLHEGTIQNTTGYGITHDSRAPIVARNVRFVGNSITPFSGASYAANIQLFNCLIADTMATWVPPAVPAADRAVYSTKHNQVADAHLIQFFGGTIIAATDQRHTASGISWKFRPTDTLRGVDFPLRLSVAKLACAASVAVSVTIWTRRDSTNINGILRLVGGQIAGVPIDVTVTCAPSINTWTQSSALTFTPTEAGVVEFTFEVYDGVGTSNNFWIDDLAVS